MKKADRWKEALKCLKIALQPIVSIQSGKCFGYEALLRGYENAGFSSIQDVFDMAARDNYLYKLDLNLRKKAIRVFSKIDRDDSSLLFYNLDNRVLESAEYDTADTDRLLEKYNVPSCSMCLEISERHHLTGQHRALTLIREYREKQYKIAVDDFGSDFAGIKLFYFSEPNFVKIDRFFISNIPYDRKKKLFVSKVVEMAHMLGVAVVAEGVETRKEYYVCKEIGCDFLQGYLIQKPISKYKKLKRQYEKIEQLNEEDRRGKNHDKWLVSEQVELIEPISVNTEMLTVFEMFRKNKSSSFFPVVDQAGHPLGMIHEKDLKEYVYSLYGKELLQNRISGKLLTDFVTKTPTASVNSKVEEILKIFSTDNNAEGVLIAQDGQYLGFLSAKSLLNILNEKNLSVARDQNPLTRLAGNRIIEEYIYTAGNKSESNFSLVYFDFDHFKPFNDKYGFREGDRAIMLFADLLRKRFTQENEFVGHIGGDDFFVGIENVDFPLVYRKVTEVAESFRSSMESFYDKRSRERGYIIAKGRDGAIQSFPLITVSSVILQMKENHIAPSPSMLSKTLAVMKKNAKHAMNKTCSASIAS